MGDIKTLDDRIRAAALAQAHKEMDAAISKLINVCLARSPFGWTPVPVEGKSQDLTTVLKQAGVRYVNANAAELGDRAVNEFMDNVERLNNEVGELRNMVEDLPRES